MNQRYSIRLPNGQYASARVERFTTATSSVFWISRFNVSPKFAGKGFGSQLLTEITNAADKSAAFLCFEAKPYWHRPLSVSELKKWYECHGFFRVTHLQMNRWTRRDCKGYGIIMLRHPRLKKVK